MENYLLSVIYSKAEKFAESLEPNKEKLNYFLWLKSELKSHIDLIQYSTIFYEKGEFFLATPRGEEDNKKIKEALEYYAGYIEDNYIRPSTKELTPHFVLNILTHDLNRILKQLDIKIEYWNHLISISNISSLGENEIKRDNKKSHEKFVWCGTHEQLETLFSLWIENELVKPTSKIGGYIANFEIKRQENLTQYSDREAICWFGKNNELAYSIWKLTEGRNKLMDKTKKWMIASNTFVNLKGEPIKNLSVALTQTPRERELLDSIIKSVFNLGKISNY